MSDVHSQWWNGNLVYYDTHRMRWLDAIGPNVVKFIDHFTRLPVDDTTGDPTEFTMTVVEVGTGDSTVALDTTEGGIMLITTAANEDDGVNLQLKGEAYKMESVKPCYFGLRMKLSEATQSDFLAGLCITDTTLLGGLTDGVYFRKVDASTDISMVAEKNSTETANVDATADTSFHIYEFLYDGNGTIYPFIDGAQGTAITTNIPDDEALTPSIHFLTGADSAETMSVDWLRAIQLR